MYENEIMEDISVKESSYDFQSLACVNMTCRCGKSKFGMSPSCHTGNGFADMIIVKKTSRINFIRYLLKLSDNGMDSFTDLSFVEVFRSNEFAFEINSRDFEAAEPVSSLQENFKWNCDGEVMESKIVNVKVHKQLLSIFASGINLNCKMK